MGIKRNFVFSALLTAANYVFPFIVYPYVSRVLGVDNIGICNFVNSVVNYAVLISMMGISIVGVRDIAKARGDRRRLGATFTSLLILCGVFTLVATTALVTATLTVEQLQPYRQLLWIGVAKLWSNFLLIDWLYKGLEDFRYITLRTILVKTCYVISVFVLIHQASDYVVYYLLTTLMVTGNALFNCVRAFSRIPLHVDWSLTRSLVKSNIVLGVYLILNSMYTTFNVVYLGFCWGDTEVGYYTTATKIFSIIIAVYTAYSSVIMPRASSLIGEGRIDEFKALIAKSMQALILIAVPISVFGMLYSAGIVYLVAGPEYTGAILPMTIVMPLIFVIGYEQIMTVQIISPMASDRVLLTISVIGAVVGVAGNILIVGTLAAPGSAIVWLMAEIVVLVSAQRYVSRRLGIGFPVRSLLINLLSYSPYILISCLVVQLVPDAIVAMLAGGALCVVYLVLVQRYLLHNPIFDELFGRMLLRLHIGRGADGHDMTHDEI